MIPTTKIIQITDSFADRLFCNQQIAFVAAQIEEAKSNAIVAYQIHAGAKFVENGNELTVLDVKANAVVTSGGSGNLALNHYTKQQFQDKILSGEFYALKEGQIATLTTRGAQILHEASAEFIEKAIRRYEKIEHLLLYKGKIPVKLTRKEQRYSGRLVSEKLTWRDGSRMNFIASSQFKKTPIGNSCPFFTLRSPW